MGERISTEINGERCFPWGECFRAVEQAEHDQGQDTGAYRASVGQSWSPTYLELFGAGVVGDTIPYGSESPVCSCQEGLPSSDPDI